MHIHGFNKTTLLDYPDHLAAVIFLGGCNFRCPFCHNASLVLSPGSQPVIEQNEVLKTLSLRKNILEGVCITGGEPTIYPELPAFIKKIKELGYKIKLDTNGYNPYMIEHLTEKKLLDYIAMDIKNSPSKYSLTTGITDINMDRINESVSFLLRGTIPYEFRTTVIREFHSKKDFELIGEWVKGASSYYLQAYKDSEDVIAPGLTAYGKEDMLSFAEVLSTYAEHVSIRGMD